MRNHADKKPTEEATSQQWCVATPLKDGTPHFMWDIDKVESLIHSTGKEKLCEAELQANAIIATIKDAERLQEEGNGKIAYMMVDFAFDEVAKSLRSKVSEYLNAKGYKQYVGSYW